MLDMHIYYEIYSHIVPHYTPTPRVPPPRSIVGEEVNGIWEAHSNKADVNSVHVSHGGHALAIGNDFGSVKLYDFPCKQQPQVGGGASGGECRRLGFLDE